MIKQLQKLTICLLLVAGLSTNTFSQSWQTVGQAGFSASDAYDSSLVFSSNGEPYVAYRNGGKNTDKPTVMKFNGTSWVTVGLPGFSTGGALQPSLALNNTNEPYIAFKDYSNSGKATVMKFNGTSWVTVGSPGFTANQASAITLAFNPINNQPYVAYQDHINNHMEITVMRFNGTSWVTVGLPGLSMGTTSVIPSLVFSSTGEPYVAYMEGGAGGLPLRYPTIMKFNGTSWVAVGTTVGRYLQEPAISIALNSKGEPYVAYGDGLNSGKCTVMKFNGTSWINVGTAGFSAGLLYTTQLDLTISSNDEPYVAYQDSANSNKTTVMKFNGTNWVNVGAVGLSGGLAAYPRIAFNPINNEPYLVYADWTNSGKVTVMRFTNSASANELQKNITAVYPNPANNVLNIDIANTVEEPNITITDITGKTIATHQLQTGSNIIDISELSSGTYFIKTEQGSSTKFMKK